MRNIGDFIRKEKAYLIFFYTLGFVLVSQRMLLDYQGSEQFLFMDWVTDSIVGTWITYEDEAKLGILCDGFRNYGDRTISNHYTQSAILLPSIFVASCWVVVSYVNSFFKRITP